MKQKLVNVHNALLEVETKGKSTVIMAQCIGVLEQMIREYDKENQGKKTE